MKIILIVSVLALLLTSAVPSLRDFTEYDHLGENLSVHMFFSVIEEDDASHVRWVVRNGSVTTMAVTMSGIVYVCGNGTRELDRIIDITYQLLKPRERIRPAIVENVCNGQGAVTSVEANLTVVPMPMSQ